MDLLEKVSFNDEGMLPVIVQDINRGEVLMMAWMNREALEKTLDTGKTHFWSRSRKRIWLKGEVSGHYQLVKEIRVDCDEDVLLIKVEQVKAACHTGYRSCFFRKVNEKGELELVAKKVFEPKKIYKT
ncbi:phosphoribosyl-AMP cyclohydrolase [Candidatus Aerophobetes bacterium Ae_b3b]|jgi:phosphoribosyl-AMP cyclohydrolase|nr:MAG: phosphoribosyl-AMP cyclohydrolase [Candidatus Aerophobetes bacterium Ae_b3b]